MMDSWPFVANDCVVANTRKQVRCGGHIRIGPMLPLHQKVFGVWEFSSAAQDPVQLGRRPVTNSQFSPLNPSMRRQIETVKEAAATPSTAPPPAKALQDRLVTACRTADFTTAVAALDDGGKRELRRHRPRKVHCHAPPGRAVQLPHRTGATLAAARRRPQQRVADRLLLSTCLAAAAHRLRRLLGR